MSGGLNECDLSALHSHTELQSAIIRTSDAIEMFTLFSVKIFHLFISVEQQRCLSGAEDLKERKDKL